MDSNDVVVGETYWLGDEDMGMAVVVTDTIDNPHQFVVANLGGTLLETISAENLTPYNDWIQQ